MITLTTRALEVIQQVSSHPQLDPSSGVRIGPRSDPNASLEVRIVHGPHEGDRVLERDGGRLYVAPAAAQRINGRELDAVTDREGRVQFVARDAA